MMNNKMKSIDEGNSDSYAFGKKDSLLLLSFFLISFLLNTFVTYRKYDAIMVYALGGYFLVVFLTTVITNQLRINQIEKKREEIQEIYRIIGDQLKFPISKNGKIDYNNVPFEVKAEGEELNKITVHITDDRNFRDSNVTYAVSSLNENFNYRSWVSQVDFPSRKCTFIGQKLPPDLAMYPGSDLRPWNWIPLGLGGNGELGWNLGAKDKDLGRSSFQYEDGVIAQNTKIPSAPQALTLGATGGGKAIWVDQEIDS